MALNKIKERIPARMPLEVYERESHVDNKREGINQPGQATMEEFIGSGQRSEI